MADATEKRSRDILIDGAKSTKAIMLATATSKGVAPGGKIAGKRWTVRYDLNPGTTPAALVRFTGPFHLVESPTKAHQIVAGEGRKRRGRGRARALRIGDQFRASASHPGTKGKRVFATGKVLAGQKVTRQMAHQMTSVWSRVIK